MSAINAMAGGAPAAASSRFSEMSSEDFVRIIFTELQNQDPFQPNDSGALLEQLNSIRSIESDMQMSARLEDIVFQNQLAGAGNLIGKRIGGLTADSLRVGGVVQSVARSGDEIALILDNGWIVPLGNLEYIDHAPPAEIPEGSGSDGGSGDGGNGGNGGNGGDGGDGGNGDGGA